MKAVKYIVLLIVIIIIAYKSVYFKKLDEVKALKAATEFNATRYARTFWENKMIPDLDKAIDILQLTTMLSSDTAKAFDTY